MNGRHFVTLSSRQYGKTLHVTLHAWLARMQYKPNYDFRLLTMEGTPLVETAHGDFRYALQIRARVPDSEGRCKPTIPVNLQMPIPPTATEGFEAFCAFVRDCITLFEDHESDEFFKIDGKHYRDPHPLPSKA